MTLQLNCNIALYTCNYAQFNWTNPCSPSFYFFPRPKNTVECSVYTLIFKFYCHYKHICIALYNKQSLFSNLYPMVSVLQVDSLLFYFKILTSKQKSWRNWVPCACTTRMHHERRRRVVHARGVRGHAPTEKFGNLDALWCILILVHSEHEILEIFRWKIAMSLAVFLKKKIVWLTLSLFIFQK